MPLKKESKDEDFFGFKENKYWVETKEDDWFDNVGNKAKSKPKPQAKPVQKQDDFDFGFGQQSQPKQSNKANDLFDFGAQSSNKEAFDFGNEDLIQPKKPNFDDYFPEENDDDEEDSGDTGLISNLKKLYKQDGFLQDEKPKTDEGILKPAIPDALKNTNKFIPEVSIKGEDFWEERKNPQLAYQQVDYSHLSSLGPVMGHNVLGGYTNMHESKSGNSLFPPTEFPTVPFGTLNIHRSHSSDQSKGKFSQILAL